MAMTRSGAMMVWLDLALGTLNVLLGALALAAVWALLSMFTLRALAPAAVLLGLGIGVLARLSLPRTRRYAALLAVLACVTAAYYQQVLLAAVRVANTLGLPLLTALRDSGPGLLTLLAGIALDGVLLAWIAAGALLALLAAWPFNRRGS